MNKKIKVIIFGSSGQDGYYLGELLLKKKIEFIGISRSNSDVNGDIGDYEFVKNLIELHKPTHIFHFAAISTTKHDALFENHKSISTGTLNILESVRLLCPESKVFISGSAMQFENNGFPIDEKTPFDPSSAYSVARIQSVFAARYYQNKFGLNVYVGYLFNHDSPLRSEQHVNQKIVKAIQRINLGSNEKLILGNIDVKKEFNFAGDIVEAIWMLINQEKIFEAIIGSGVAFTIRDWVSYCFNKINKNWEDYVIIQNDFISDYEILISRPFQINRLGWKGREDFTKLADLMMSS